MDLGLSKLILSPLWAWRGEGCGWTPRYLIPFLRFFVCAQQLLTVSGGGGGGAGEVRVQCDLAPVAYGVAAAPGLALWGPVPVASGGLCAGVLGGLRPLVSSEAPHLVGSCALQVVLGWVPGHSPVLGPHMALSLSTFFPSLQPASHL